MVQETALNARTVNVDGLLNDGSNVYEIPDFQRDYQWGQDELEDFWTDLVTSARNDRTHYLGQVILVNSTEEDLFKIIDGQQRIATISILMIAIRDAVNDGSVNVRDYLYKTGPTSDTERKLRLLEQSEPYDNDQYKNLCEAEGGSSNTEGNITAAYDYFSRKISSLDSLGVDDIIKTLVKDFELTRMETRKMSSAYQIFQTENRRGLELPPIDLAKSMVIEKAANNPDVDVEAVKDMWLETTALVSDLSQAAPRRPIRYVLEVTNDDFGRSDTGAKAFIREFESLVDGISDSEYDILGLLSSLYENCREYKKAKEGRLEMENSDLQSEINQTLRQCQFCYPHGGIITFYISNQIESEQKMLDAARLMRMLAVRVNLGNITGARKIRAGPDAVRRALDGMDIIESLKEAIRTETPADSTLQKRIKEREFLRNRITRLVLLELEREHFSNRSDEYTISDFQIEHIAPVKAFSDEDYKPWRSSFSHNEEKFNRYSDRLGNLLPLEERQNKSASDNPFTDKKAKYAQSNFSMATDVVSGYDSWSFSSIENRSESLSKLVVETWSL